MPVQLEFSTTIHLGATIDNTLEVLDTLYIRDASIYDLAISLQDAIVFSDFSRSRLGLLVSEYLTVTDSHLIKWNGTKTLADSFFIYEDIKFQFIKTINEALTLTDSPSAMFEFILSEFILFTESVIANWNTTRTVTDRFSIAESISAQLQLLITESLDLTDAQILSLQFALTDFFSLSSSVIPNWNTTRTVTDKILLIDSFIQAVQLAINESLELTDTNTTQLQLILSEFVALLENVIPNWNTTRIISDTINLVDIFTETLQLFIIESLELTDSQSAQLQLTLSEFVKVSDTLITNWNTARILTDNINIADLVYQQLSLFLSESLNVTDSTPLSQLGLAIYEYLGFTELISSPGVFSNSVSDRFNTTDTISIGYTCVLSDILSLVSTSNVVRLLLNSVTENIGLSETLENRLNSVLPISDSLIILDTITNTGVLYNTIQDAIALNVIVELGDEVWECYVLNTPKFLPSIYSGFNFNSYTVFDNRAYGCKSDGIYELSGSTDNGVSISTGVQLSTTRFGIPNQKHFRKAYIGIIGSTPYLSTETESGETKTYSIDTDGEVDMTRALRSKKWKLTLTNFTQLDFIKLIPVVLAK